MTKGTMVHLQELQNDAGEWRFADRFAVLSFTNSCGRLAELLKRAEKSGTSTRAVSTSAIKFDVVPCEQCGSPARSGQGLCLNCALKQGLDCDTASAAHWEEVLEEVDVLPNEWRIGNYQIIEEIGRGGMGVIYRAIQRNSQRVVALKRILSVHADSRETLTRFRREGATVASLRHPNILPIYELSETEDGLPFFTMKFASGGSLLEAGPRLRQDPRRIGRLIAKVSRAVQHAHRQRVLHRDIKPGNILLDDQGEPLVSDFGLVKSLDSASDLTRTGMSFGTPGFIAPEQANGSAKDLTAAADIYSIGALLFYLLTGRPPFVGENAFAVIKEATDKPAPKLRTFAPQLDRALEIICVKCLEREPQARYSSALDLAEDLERWLGGRSIVARQVSAPVRFWRWSKRNPKFASALAATLLLAVLNILAALTISHFLSIVSHARVVHHTVASVRFEDLRELATTLNSITEARNPCSPAEQKFNTSHGSTQKAGDDVRRTAGDPTVSP
jgi:eukaryotic-like serine/threonine-protein kinase